MKKINYILIILAMLMGLSRTSHACKELSIDCSNDIDLGYVVAGTYVEFNSSIHSTLFHISGQLLSLVCTDVITETEQAGVTIELEWKIGNTPCFICFPYNDGTHWLLTGSKYIKMSVKSVEVESTAQQGEYSFVQTVQVQYMGI